MPSGRADQIGGMCERRMGARRSVAILHAPTQGSVSPAMCHVESRVQRKKNVNQAAYCLRQRPGKRLYGKKIM